MHIEIRYKLQEKTRPHLPQAYVSWLQASKDEACDISRSHLKIRVLVYWIGIYTYTFKHCFNTV